MAEKLWLKRVNVPIWVIQLIVLLIFTGTAAIALYVVADAGDQLDLGDNVENVLNAAAAIQLAFSVFTIIMVIVEIILSATHRLGPVANIVIQCIKSLIWTVFFAIAIRAAVVGSESIGGIFLLLVMWLTCIAQLIYGAVIVHRHRKGTLRRGNYALTAGGQPQNTTYQPQYEGVTGGGYASQQHNPFQDSSHWNAAPYPHSAETAYTTQGAAQGYYGGGNGNAYEMHGTQRY